MFQWVLASVCDYINHVKFFRKWVDDTSCMTKWQCSAMAGTCTVTLTQELWNARQTGYDMM